MSKTSYICNCDVIHEDIVNAVSYTHLHKAKILQSVRQI